MKTTSSPYRRLATAGVASLVVLLGACASKGVAPIDQLATARASIAQAESAGAMKAAPLELLAARDKLRKAESAVREERFAQARQFAEEAEADGELAERKARAVSAQAAADALARSNAVLHKEAERKARP